MQVTETKHWDTNSNYKTTKHSKTTKQNHFSLFMLKFLFLRWLIEMLYMNMCADSILPSKYKSDTDVEVMDSHVSKKYDFIV